MLSPYNLDGADIGDDTEPTGVACLVSAPLLDPNLLVSCLKDPDEEDVDDDTDSMLPPGEVRTGADVEAGEEAVAEGLKPADIDAYWLQRNVNKAYSNSLDENEAVKKAEEVFNALQVGILTPMCCCAAQWRISHNLLGFLQESVACLFRMLDCVMGLFTQHG